MGDHKLTAVSYFLRVSYKKCVFRKGWALGTLGLEESNEMRDRRRGEVGFIGEGERVGTMGMARNERRDVEGSKPVLSLEGMVASA